MKTKILFIIMVISLLFAYGCKKEDINKDNKTTPTEQTVTDIDGNVYNTVTIGTQIWMKENLKVTHYRNGDPIPNIIVDTTWFNIWVYKLKSGAMCYYNNDSIINKATYGGLYNWYAVNDSRNIAPVGWHIPTDAEWTTLTDYSGGNVAGGGLKETGTLHWISPNTGATNETGFTALPGGDRAHSGTFDLIGRYGRWWSSTGYLSGAYSRMMDYSFSFVDRLNTDKELGLSVRCVKN